MKEVLRATSFSLLPLELGGFGVCSALGETVSLGLALQMCYIIEQHWEPLTELSL